MNVKEIECSACGWSGMSSQCEIRVDDGWNIFHCPECYELLDMVTDDVEEEW